MTEKNNANVYKMSIHDIDLDEIIKKANNWEEIDEIMEDEELEEDNRYYALQFMLNIPPLIVPLGDAHQTLTIYDILKFPALHINLQQGAWDTRYNILYKITENMGVFERKFFLYVLGEMLKFEYPTREKLCAALVAEMAIPLRKEMCKDFFRARLLKDYVDYKKGAVLIKKEILVSILGEWGSTLYDAYLDLK